MPDAGARLTAALLSERGWRVVDLPESMPGAMAHAWAQSWPGAVHRAPGSLNLHLPVAPVADLLGIPALTGPYVFSLAGLVLGAILLFARLRPDPLLLARERAAAVATEPRRRFVCPIGADSSASP